MSTAARDQVEAETQRLIHARTVANTEKDLYVRVINMIISESVQLKFF